MNLVWIILAIIIIGFALKYLAKKKKGTKTPDSPMTPPSSPSEPSIPSEPEN